MLCLQSVVVAHCHTRRGWDRLVTVVVAVGEGRCIVGEHGCMMPELAMVVTGIRNKSVELGFRYRNFPLPGYLVHYAVCWDTCLLLAVARLVGGRTWRQPAYMYLTVSPPACDRNIGQLLRAWREDLAVCLWNVRWPSTK